MRVRVEDHPDPELLLAHELEIPVDMTQGIDDRRFPVAGDHVTETAARRAAELPDPQGAHPDGGPEFIMLTHSTNRRSPSSGRLLRTRTLYSKTGGPPAATVSSFTEYSSCAGADSDYLTSSFENAARLLRKTTTEDCSSGVNFM